MHSPNMIKSFVAGGDIAARRIVKILNNGAAAQAADPTENNVGVTELACAAGDTVDVVMGGITEVTAGDNITCGDFVTADNSGKAIPAAEWDTVLGVALDSAAEGEYVPVRLCPGRRAAEPRSWINWGATADGAIASKRIVTATASGVAQASADNAGLVGVAMQDAADEGGVDVAVSGIVEVTAGGTIDAADLLTADANGKAVKASYGDRIVGVAMTGGSADDNILISINCSLHESQDPLPDASTDNT